MVAMLCYARAASKKKCVMKGDKPVENSHPSAPARGGSTIVYLFVAGIFAAAGILIGMMLSGGQGGSLSRAEVEEVVRGVVREELANVSLAGGVDREMLQEIVAEAVGSSSGPSQNDVLADNDPFLGAEDGVVTIVEFSDFNCGFCTRFAMETLPQIIDNYGDRVKFVYRDMPILSETSSAAAEASHCAHDQGKFWEFHDFMFTDATARTRDAFIKFAEDNALDVAEYTDCIDSGKHGGEVTLDLIDGQGLGVRGTPAFFINGRFVSGAQPYEVFQTVIEAELAKIDAQGS